MVIFHCGQGAGLPIHCISISISSTEVMPNIFFRYQMGHMYLRYLGWQFIGRSGEVEGANVDWSQLWGLPFLIGLFGAFSHFRREWKMGSVVTALFILTGAALVIYLNQTEPQPRERDYSYTGSFFAFALWIGIGAESLLSQLRKRLSGETLQRALTITALGGLLLIVNGRMLLANYHTHDRSGNFVAWDWAWNILQSCETDAILFTNGDNDTFPLWYLQEVEGIRTDVRVVNLSLANTGWYLDQLKNTSPNGAKKIVFSLSDEELREISYVAIEPVEVDLPAGSRKEELAEEYRQKGLDLPDALVDTLRWQVKPSVTFRGQGFLRPQDVAVYEILMNNFAMRPIYFALTVGHDNMLGIEDYLRLEGLTYKVVPVKNIEEGNQVDISTLWTNLLTVFRYRNLDNPEVYIEETSRRLSGNYKPLFVSLAVALAEQPEEDLQVRDKSGALRNASRRKLALEALDRSQEVLPLKRYGIDPGVASTIVSLYVSLGEKEKADLYITFLEQLADLTSLRETPQVYYALALSLREVGREDESKKILDQLFREIDENNIELLKE